MLPKTADLSPEMQWALRQFAASTGPRFLLHLFERPTGEYHVRIDIADRPEDENGMAFLVVDGDDIADRYANLYFALPASADEAVPTICVVTLRANALTVNYQTSETAPSVSEAQTVLWNDQWSDPTAIEEFLEQAEFEAGPSQQLSGLPATDFRTNT